MKKTNITITMLCLAACLAAADTKITWLADVTADRAETVTGVQSNVIAAAAAHIPRTDNPHGVTAASLGAITAEQDLAALRTYHYGSPDIVESPAEWFVFDGAGTITAFNWEAGRTNVVIPWAIGGVPVTAIMAYAFAYTSAESVIAPKTVTVIDNGAFVSCILLTSINLPQATSIGDSTFSGCSALTSVTVPQVTSMGEYAFAYCYSLTSINLPQATSIGNSAFANCSALASVHMGQNAPAEATDVFAYITPPPNVYVTDPQATGWGATWNGAPVVRPPLYADAIYQAGELVATTAALAVHTNRADNPHNVTAVQIGALTAELDPVANAALTIHTNRNDNPHSVTAAQIGALTSETDTAALAALAAYAAYWPKDATASSWFAFVTNSGAITITGYNIAGGTDVVIPDYINGWPVTEIGANAFAVSGVTSIGGAGNVVTAGDSAFNYCTSLSSVSLPQLQTARDNAFYHCTSLSSVSLPQLQTAGDAAFANCTSLSSVSLPQVQTVGSSAFANCTSLSSVSLPQLQTVGSSAFSNCSSLTSLYFGNDAPAIGAYIFADITPNQVTIYVTNPTATGWGATLDGMPVVRPTLSADAIYQAGELVATEAHVAQALAAIPEPDLSDHPTFSQVAASNALPYTAWTGTVTPVNGTATVTIAHGNMPVLVTTAPCVLTLDPTGYGTSGVSRVSLSYYPGENSFTFATDVIQYAETPTVDTSGWNTLLIRRVSNGAWKGVGL